MLLKARIYRLIGIIFALLGLFLFGATYFEKYQGNLFAAFRDPLFALFILTPFVPAVVLAFMASGCERKAERMLDEKP